MRHLMAAVLPLASPEPPVASVQYNNRMVRRGKKNKNGNGRQRDRKTHACESPVVLWPGCRNVEAFPAHCTNEEIASATWCHCKSVFIDRLQILAIYLFLIYSFIFKLYKSSSPLPAFKWKFVVFYLIRCERDIFSVLACQGKGEEHGFCEQWNICPKAERQEVIVPLLMLDLNKTFRKQTH